MHTHTRRPARLALTALVALLAVVAVVAVAANRALGIERPSDLMSERYAFEMHDGLLVAVRHGANGSHDMLARVGRLTLRDGCWYVDPGRLMAFPRGTRWADDAHTTVVLPSGTLLRSGDIYSFGPAGEGQAPDDAPCHGLAEGAR